MEVIFVFVWCVEWVDKEGFWIGQLIIWFGIIVDWECIGLVIFVKIGDFKYQIDEFVIGFEGEKDGKWVEFDV